MPLRRSSRRNVKNSRSKLIIKFRICDPIVQQGMGKGGNQKGEDDIDEDDFDEGL
jgi:hypothetical protein